MSEPSCDKRGHIMSPTSPRCGVCGVYSSQMMLVTREVYEQTRQRLAAAEKQYNELQHVVECNKKLLVENDLLTARLAAAEAHEQQTHERLGAILGTDTSLEDAAKRMAERLAAAERVLECGHTARFTTSHFGGEKHGESYCTLCELDALTARLAAAEAARGIAEQQLTVICDGVNRRCGADNHQLPLVSLDRLLASHERDLAECRRLLREACIAYENNFDDATSDKRLRRIGVFHTWYERAARAAGGV